MVWTWTWQFCHVPACQRVHRQSCGDVTLELGFLAWAFATHYSHSSDSYTLHEFATFDDAVYVSLSFCLTFFLISDTWFVVWLRPSKQIRAPLFSTKQKRQRRWIVIKYTVVYLLMISLLASLIVLRKCCSFHPFLLALSSDLIPL